MSLTLADLAHIYKGDSYETNQPLLTLLALAFALSLSQLVAQVEMQVPHLEKRLPRLALSMTSKKR